MNRIAIALVVVFAGLQAAATVLLRLMAGGEFVSEGVLKLTGDER